VEEKKRSSWPFQLRHSEVHNSSPFLPLPTSTTTENSVRATIGQNEVPTIIARAD